MQWSGREGPDAIGEQWCRQQADAMPGSARSTLHLFEVPPFQQPTPFATPSRNPLFSGSGVMLRFKGDTVEGPTTWSTRPNGDDTEESARWVSA
jgi:hypothetical protein